jgi:hypothetical protein
MQRRTYFLVNLVLPYIFVLDSRQFMTAATNEFVAEYKRTRIILLVIAKHYTENLISTKVVS